MRPRDNGKDEEINKEEINKDEIIDNKEERFVSGNYTTEKMRHPRKAKKFERECRDNINMVRAMVDEDLTEQERKEIILRELNSVKKSIDGLVITTDCRARWYRNINTLFNLIIISCSAVIIGIEAASDCLNIPVIVLSSIIFIVKSCHTLFRWGPLGVLYKYGNTLLRRISRQARTYIYQSRNYTTDQLLALMDQIQEQYDDVEVSLYSSSVSEPVNYDTGLRLNDNNKPNNPTNNNSASTSMPSMFKLGQNLKDDSDKPDSSPHLHIHIDNSPRPNKNKTVIPDDRDDILLTPVTRVETENLAPITTKHISPAYSSPRMKVRSNTPVFMYPVSEKGTPEAPLTPYRTRTPRMSSNESHEVVLDIPTIFIDSESEVFTYFLYFRSNLSLFNFVDILLI